MHFSLSFGVPLILLELTLVLYEKVFRTIISSDFMITFASDLRQLLKSSKSKHRINQIHAYIVTTNLLLDSFISGNLFQSILNLNPPLPLAYSLSLLQSFPNPSAFIYNSLIHHCIQNDKPNIALNLYDEMLTGKNSIMLPNRHTFPLVTKALSQLLLLKKGRNVHCTIIKFGFCNNQFVQSSLVHFYSTCGYISDAHSVFDDITEPSLASWTALLSGHAKNGDLKIARRLFDEMPHKNEVSWAAMISGYVQNGYSTEALLLFQEMLVLRIKPCTSVLVSVLTAIAELGALQEGRWVHAYIERFKWPKWTTNMITSVVHMYYKCGDLRSARQAFDKMRGKQVDVWNAMILGLGLHGEGKEALLLYNDMIDTQIVPDDLTFIGVLSGCSHSGLVKEAIDCFEDMMSVHRIVPKIEHYSCMVNILGKAGLLEEAMKVIESMPMKPNGRIWGSLFGACKVHDDAKLGEIVGKQLIELDPYKARHYVLLANLYVSMGRYEDANAVRESMKSRDVELEPGRSLIDD